MVCVTGQWSTGRTAAVKCTYEGSTHFTQLNHYGLCYHINTKIHFGLIIVISYQVFHMKKIVLIDLWLCKIEYEQGLTRRGKGRNLLWEGDGCRCDSWDICCLCMDPTFRHVQWPRTVNGWIFPTPTWRYNNSIGGIRIKVRMFLLVLYWFYSLINNILFTSLNNNFI